MAETFGFSAKVGADVSGFQKGMQKAEKSLKKFADGITNIGKKGIVGSLANVTLAMGGVATAFKTATKVVKEVAKAVGECTEAYKQQAIVERTLDTAIKNNPYVTGKALQNLKQFASDMQKISNVGDEQIIKLETQLISLGRTEEETMNIIRVAMDMSASGTMSLDTAITQLNATLNGNIGRLGQQNAELKNLTEEELKSGKAVEILGEKFKGLSQATVDTSTQLKNIKGDFKEAIGEFTLPSSDMWNKFWMGFYEKGIDVVHKLQASLDSSRGEGIYEKLAGSVKKIKNEEEQRRAINDALSMSTEIELNQLQTYLEGLKKRNALQEKTLEEAKATLQYRKDAEEAYQRGLALEEQDEARRQAELDAQKEKEDEIVKLKEEYLKKVAEQERKWKNIKDVTGEEVDAQEKIKFYQDSLVDLMTQAGGQISTNNQLYKDQIAIIQKLQTGLQPEEKETSNTWEKKLREQMIARLEADKEEKLAEVENSKMASWQKEQVEINYNEKLKALKLEALEIEKQEALDSVKDLANADEERLRIQEYYEKEKFDLIVEYAKKNKQAGEIASDSFVSGFKTVTKKLAPIMKEIGKTLSKISSVAKSMFTGGVSIFKKIFDIDLDSVLDAILKIEDKVLTFFVETLPRLPAFVESVMQSISVLLENVMQIVTPERVKDIIGHIMETIMQYAPIIIESVAYILNNILDGLIDSIPDILDTLNLLAEKLAEELPNLIQRLIDLFIAILKEPDKVAQFVVSMIKMIAEVFNTLVKNIGPLLEALLPAIAKIVWEIIKALPDVLTSLVKSLGEGVKGVGKAVGKFFKDLFTGKLFASGTPSAPKGLAIVGEKGPELVNFKGGEQVLSNRNTQKALAGIGNNGNVFNVTFNNTLDTTAFAMMSQLKQYNRQLAINGII